MNSIEELIKHRAPALCIDEVTACSDVAATCELTIKDGPLVQGGLLWEPALVEAVAQTAAVMGGFYLRQLGTEIDRGWLVGVRNFSILRAPRVGEVITCRVQSLRRLDQFVLVEGSVRCGDELLAEGHLKFYEVVA